MEKGRKNIYEYFPQQFSLPSTPPYLKQVFFNISFWQRNMTWWISNPMVPLVGLRYTFVNVPGVV